MVTAGVAELVAVCVETLAGGRVSFFTRGITCKTNTEHNERFFDYVCKACGQRRGAIYKG